LLPFAFALTSQATVEVQSVYENRSSYTLADGDGVVNVVYTYTTSMKALGVDTEAAFLAKVKAALSTAYDDEKVKLKC
jgi:predicted HAD superfamily Cof-like phosphohydrolase